MTTENDIPILSTGDPSTIGNWLKLTKALFGPESGATKFWEETLAHSEEEGNGGADEAVVADEGQCLYLNFQLHTATQS